MPLRNFASCFANVAVSADGFTRRGRKELAKDGKGKLCHQAD
jgi:hypothetical protein